MHYVFPSCSLSGYPGQPTRSSPSNVSLLVTSVDNDNLVLSGQTTTNNIADNDLLHNTRRLHLVALQMETTFDVDGTIETCARSPNLDTGGEVKQM
jgi:hypothetical protein